MTDCYCLLLPATGQQGCRRSILITSNVIHAGGWFIRTDASLTPRCRRSTKMHEKMSTPTTLMTNIALTCTDD